ncbi:MAG: ABC-2 transporter permease [Pseudomonadota bacterium]|nr:ABC-2 transporter permease [Pseudomonadota bacterium]
MSRFFWLIRREIWEHKAIWIAPAVVIGCILLLLMTGRVQLGPYGGEHGALPMHLSQEERIALLMLAYAGLAVVVFLVMGIIAFFYSIDSLYADRRDRSVLFWKSLPLSDAETVLSKFATAAVVIPLVALIAAVISQFVVAAGASMQFGSTGLPADLVWHPRAIFGGIGIAVLWCGTAMLWYAPFVAYLMLASAWAPKGPFLWAVLPPVGAWILESVVMRSEFIGDFITERLFALYFLLRNRGPSIAGEISDEGDVSHLAAIDIAGMLRDFYVSPELWLGVVAAGVLLAAAMWVRRYRDETA